MTSTVVWLAIVLLYVVYTFNRLVRLRNQVRTAWSDVDVQLSLRHDLVPNLVTLVQAYAAHEKAVLGAVSTARAEALVVRNESLAAQRGPAEVALGEGLNRLIALREAYPLLKANQDFLKLHDELVAVEDQLQNARRYYNGCVRDLNDAIQRFPGLILARMGRIELAEYFQADASSRSVPSVAR